jgi:hypothetical protein
MTYWDTDSVEFEFDVERKKLIDNLNMISSIDRSLGAKYGTV